MAGIRGAKNPMPVKQSTASGIFKQRGDGPSKDSGAMSAAYASKRKDPKAGRNSGTAPNKSHYQNSGLKRGTSDR